MLYLLKNSFKSLKQQKVIVIALTLLYLLSVATLSFGKVNSNMLSSSRAVIEENSGTYDYSFAEKEYQTNEENPDTVTLCNSLFSIDITAANDDIREVRNKDCAKQLIEKKIKDLGLNYKKRRVKMIEPTSDNTFDEHFYLVVEQFDDGNIARNWVVSGRLAENANEVSISPKYAKINNLNIGDSIKIKSKDYQIVGTSVTYDMSVPLLGGYLAPNFEKEGIAYVNTAGYERISEATLPSRAVMTHHFIKGDPKTLNSYALTHLKDVGDKFVYHIYDEGGPFNIIGLRLLNDQVTSNELINFIFVIFILTICIWVMMVVIRSVIQKNKMQIGVLKALGYSRFEIAFSYLSYAFTIGVIGGVLGVVAGYVTSSIVIGVYDGFFSFPLYINSTSVADFLYLFWFPFALLTIPILLFTWLSLRKRALILMKKGEVVKSNFLVRLFGKLLRKRKFVTRFKYSQALKAPAKLLTIFSTIFMSSILIIFLFSGLALFSQMLDASFGASDYDGSIRFGQSTYTTAVEEVNLEEFNPATDNGKNIQGKYISLWSVRNAYKAAAADPVIGGLLASSDVVDSIVGELLVNAPDSDPSVLALKERKIVVGGAVIEEGSELYNYQRLKLLKQVNGSKDYVALEATKEVNRIYSWVYGVDENNTLWNPWKSNKQAYEAIKNYSGSHIPVVTNSRFQGRSTAQVGEVIEFTVNDKVFKEGDADIVPYMTLEVVANIDEFGSTSIYSFPEHVSKMYEWYTQMDITDGKTLYNGKLYKGKSEETTKYVSMGYEVKEGNNPYIYNKHVLATDEMAPLLVLVGINQGAVLTNPETYHPLLLNYSDITNLAHLIKSFTNLFNLMESSLNIYLYLALLISTVIIAVTAIIVIQDNRRTVVTLKVLGYETKEIRKMVLTIYVPFIIFAFLLSIPTTQLIFNIIERLMLERSNTSLPLSFDFWILLRSFISLSIISLLAIYQGYRSLKKVTVKEL